MTRTDCTFRTFQSLTFSHTRAWEVMAPNVPNVHHTPKPARYQRFGDPMTNDLRADDADDMAGWFAAQLIRYGVRAVAPERTTA